MKNSLKENQIIPYFTTLQAHQTGLLRVVCMTFVIAIYIWFISFGTWTKWNNTSNYYNQLASAFIHGSLSLEKPVNPALLSLKNPYNPSEREGINYPLDFSLYKGKYYLYFGPAPAVMLAISKLWGIANVGDQYLAFIFIVGLFIFQSLLLIELRKNLLPNIPEWVLLSCIVFGGLISPWTWMLTEARLYEVANASGQFFFLAGLYFNILALRKDSALPLLLLIGSSLWACSLGSRITEALPIGFLAFMVVLLFVNRFFKTRERQKVIHSIASLSIPLIIGFAILGWYNWARFGSVFETGFSYELTSPYLQKYSKELFLPVYVLPNLYEYLIAPPKIIGIFPFFEPIRNRGYLFFPYIVLPKVYSTRPITGILFSVPFLFFAGLAIISMLFPKVKIPKQDDSNNSSYSLRWVIAGLLGAFIFGFAPIVSYFWVVTRYIADFSPSLVILSIIGFWLGYHFLIHWPTTQKIYTAGSIGLMLVSVFISNFLVFSMRESIYQTVNPILWNQLSDLFSIMIRK